MNVLKLAASQTQQGIKMEFDKQGNIIAKAHIDAKVQACNDMLAEINEQGYTSIVQVRMSLLKQIETFEKLRVNHE